MNQRLKRWIQKHKVNLLIALFLLLCLPFSPSIDLYVSSLFYDGNDFSYRGHDFIVVEKTKDILRMSIWIALAILVLGFFNKKFRHWRSAALVIIFAYVFGYKLLTYNVLKPAWLRPRPFTIEQFGGNKKFFPVYKINLKGSANNRSFPSGAMSLCFLLYPFCLVFKKYRKKYLQNLFLGLLIFMTALFAFNSIAQGRHFISDVMGSALVMVIVTNLVVLVMDKFGRSGIRKLF